MESHEIPWFQTTKQYNSPSDWINLDNMDNAVEGTYNHPGSQRFTAVLSFWADPPRANKPTVLVGFAPTLGVIVSTGPT